MIRRLTRLFAAGALASASLIPLAAPVGAIIDTDEIEAAADDASCTSADADCIALAAAAPAIDLRGANNVLNEDQINFGNIVEGDDIEIEGDFTSVDCDTNYTDSRASGGAASGSLPNQNAGGLGLSSRCVGEADNAFLGDTSDNDTLNTQDNDVCVVDADDDGVADEEELPPGLARRAGAGGGGGPINCVQAPSTVNTDVEVSEELELEELNNL